MELSKFGPADVVGPAYTSAISLMAGADALILDLRRNGGGSPSSVAYLLSHFFPPGDKRHLNDLYDRPSNTTREYWTLTTVTERYRKPVYVLTSARTGWLPKNAPITSRRRSAAPWWAKPPWAPPIP